MSSRLAVLPIGGAGEMGHHHLAAELGDDAFLIDCGSRFPGQEAPGFDRILPPFGAAQALLRSGRLRALLLTHGHLDHIGAIADLLPTLPDVPVFGTEWTLALLGGRLDEAAPSIPRQRLHEVRPGAPLRLGDTTILWHRVTHSLPSACSLSLEHEAGTVVHSGDFRIQDEPLIGDTTDAASFRSLGDRGVDVALIDSTRTGIPGATLPERVVRDHLVDAVSAVTGLCVVATFGSHVERVAALLDVARRTGRRLAVYGRSLERQTAMAVERGLLPARTGEFVDAERAASLPRRDVLLATTGAQGEIRTPVARFARGEDPKFRLGPGDTVLFSARAIPGNEIAIGSVVNALVERGVTVRPPWGGGPPIHTSGHAGRAEVETLWRWLRPRYVVPIHGEPWHLAEAKRAFLEMGHREDRVVSLRSGLRADFSSGDVRIDAVDTGTAVAVTGSLRFPLGDEELRERRRAGSTGAVSVAVPWNEKGQRLAGPPAVTTFGAFPSAERDERERALEKIAALAAEERRGTIEERTERVRQNVRRAVADLAGEKPACRVRFVIC